MKELVHAFKALKDAPRALWILIFAFSFDGMAYFGILPLMKAYLGKDIGIAPAVASVWVSLFTGALTLLMLFVGKPVENRLGIRKGIALALGLAIVGRAAYCISPVAGGAALVAVALLVVALGEGIIQPVAYAGIKRYTDEKTGPMGYAMLYAFMNLGAALVGPISAKVRTTWDAKKAAGESVFSGFGAVSWVCTGITAVTLLVFLVLMTPKAEHATLRSDVETKDGAVSSVGRSPYRDKRFLFFIFALLPVRTLFAHQWLTMPEYVLRAYSKDVADRMEWLVDSVNPLVIFLAVPMLTALTRNRHVLTMMILGSAVSAVSTFMLCAGAHTPLLVAYFVAFSIGEALWSSRFLEYAAEIAPPGRVAQYMGVANLPWFVAKSTTGFYSGVMLERFVPAEGPRDAETLWFIYGVIAMASPVLLVLARRWLLAGMDEKPELAAAA